MGDRNKTVRKSIEMDTDLDRWFKETYPGTSLWWFINTLCRAFKDQHNPPNRNKLLDHIENAVSEVHPER